MYYTYIRLYVIYTLNLVPLVSFSFTWKWSAKFLTRVSTIFYNFNFSNSYLVLFLIFSHYTTHTHTYMHLCVCVCLCMRFSFAFCAALPTFSIWICLLWQLLNWPVRLHNVCVPVYVCVCLSVCVAHYTLIHVFKAFFSFALRCCWVECAYMKRHNTLGAHCTLSVRNEAYAWCAAVCPRLQSAS